MDENAYSNNFRNLEYLYSFVVCHNGKVNLIKKFLNRLKFG